MLFTLTNAAGLEARIMDFGGVVLSLTAPDCEGRMADVVLGFGRLEDYFDNKPHFGAAIGRVGNRIRNGRFDLDGMTYQLARNMGAHHLHGGIRNFSHVLWQAEPMEQTEAAWLRLTYKSPDGDEGYPGELLVTMDYALTDQNELAIVYRAETTKPTPVNLTHHSYFNLVGDGGGDILDHSLWVAADHYLPTDEGQIPLGETAPVEGTPFDFRTEKRIGEEIGAGHIQLHRAGGYDHSWVLRKEMEGALSLGARLSEPRSRRIMEVWTTEPAVQVYTGNYLSGEAGKRGPYAPRTGICLETQGFPNAMNEPNFPSVILRPGAVYESETRYRFLIGR